MCKKLLLFFLTLAFSKVTFGEGLNYYGRIYSGGNPATSNNAQLTFQITGNDPSCIIYEEVHSNVTIKNGLLNEIIGIIGSNNTLTYRPAGIMTVEGVFKNNCNWPAPPGPALNDI